MTAGRRGAAAAVEAASEGAARRRAGGRRDSMAGDRCAGAAVVSVASPWRGVRLSKQALSAPAVCVSLSLRAEQKRDSARAK
jgi:hypothetical protein